MQQAKQAATKAAKQTYNKVYTNSLSKSIYNLGPDELVRLVRELPAQPGPSADTKRKLIKQARTLLRARHGLVC